MRSPHPPHEPPPVYSPRRRHNSPCGRIRCLSRQRMASVASAWSMGTPRGCLTLRLTPEERNARAGSDGAPDALAPAHIPRMRGAKDGGAAGKPVTCLPARNLSACLPWPACVTDASPGQSLTLAKLDEPGGRTYLPVFFLFSREYSANDQTICRKSPLHLNR